MTEPDATNSSQPPRVSPDELTERFRMLGLCEGDRVVMHASLSSVGLVEGGAAMVLHRLLNVIGKKGLLLMPTFTSITRHSSTRDSFTKVGCWCEGREARHLPFISELQPDKEMGEVAYRLCSWPGSRRSRHPAFSFVAVGQNSDELVSKHSLTDPLRPLSMLLDGKSFVLTIGVGLESVSAIHLAEQRHIPTKFVKERALTIGSKGQAWVDVTAPGCCAGFQILSDHISPNGVHQAHLGAAVAILYPMKELCNAAERLLVANPAALNCQRPDCLSCRSIQR
jgi:aminoglycoside 3-N-acetyltransferase